MKTIEIILKTAERCNLNCSYCYFFHGGDESYKKHPAFLSIDVCAQVIEFIKQAVNEHKFQRVQIDFHGGEPLLQNKIFFERNCQLIYDNLNDIVDLRLVVQTNATLVDESWIDIFQRFKIHVGVSLDGPKKFNDVFRIDHSGLGSYNAAVKGIRKLQKAAEQHRIDACGVLCVIDPSRNGVEIYRHFVDELKFTRLDFLLPDLTHDTFDAKYSYSYGEYLCSIFDEWVKDNNPNIYIRILNSTIGMLLGGESHIMSIGPDSSKNIVITISSNGDLYPDDTLRSTNYELAHTGLNVKNTTLAHFLSQNINMEMTNIKEYQALPEQCKECCWMNICRGGSAVHRFSKKNAFLNPSVMCPSLKLIFSYIARYLVSKGISQESFNEALCLN